MCGHIHTAADKWLGDVHYLNSGDWVESLTAIVEHRDGRFELVDFASFRRNSRWTGPMEMEPARKPRRGRRAGGLAELREFRADERPGARHGAGVVACHRRAAAASSARRAASGAIPPPRS